MRYNAQDLLSRSASSVAKIAFSHLSRGIKKEERIGRSSGMLRVYYLSIIRDHPQSSCHADPIVGSRRLGLVVVHLSVFLLASLNKGSRKDPQPTNNAGGISTSQLPTNLRERWCQKEIGNMWAPTHYITDLIKKDNYQNMFTSIMNKEFITS